MITARMFAAFAASVKNNFHARSKVFFAALEGGGDVLNVTEKNALDRFVRDISGEPNSNYMTYDIWNKGRAGYPMIGGTSTSHRWNIFDPRDLDAAHRLTFVGSPTHSATGISFNGTSQYARTHLNDSLLPVHDKTGSIYLRSASGSNPWAWGAFASPNNIFGIRVDSNGNVGGVGFNLSALVTVTATFPNYALSVVSSTVGRVHNNGSAIYTPASIGANSSALEIFIGCLNNNGNPAFYANISTSFFAVWGAALTDVEHAALNNAIQAYQTALSRQI